MDEVFEAWWRENHGHDSNVSRMELARGAWRAALHQAAEEIEVRAEVASDGAKTNNYYTVAGLALYLRTIADSIRTGKWAALRFRERNGIAPR